jgi:uncharacterized UBP type Zn finger protein
MDSEVCRHLQDVREIAPRTPGACEECVKVGDSWVHLRLCMECGQVGCCNDSKNKHAMKHALATSHPVVRSVEPGERWLYCYVDEIGYDPE